MASWLREFSYLSHTGFFFFFFVSLPGCSQSPVTSAQESPKSSSSLHGHYSHTKYPSTPGHTSHINKIIFKNKLECRECRNTIFDQNEVIKSSVQAKHICKHETEHQLPACHFEIFGNLSFLIRAISEN